MKKTSAVVLAIGSFVLFAAKLPEENRFVSLFSSEETISHDLGNNHIDSLIPFPNVKKGERTPFDLWRYGGKGKSSFMNPNLPMSWDEWLAFHEKQKPTLMKDVREYMNTRYNFSGKNKDPKRISR